MGAPGPDHTSGAARPRKARCRRRYIRPMHKAVLLLGGNTGDPPVMLGRARELIAGRMGRIIVQSRQHWTEPWGFKDDRPFLDQALLVEVEMPAAKVMRTCLEIEAVLGRVRDPASRYAARSIDIDLLFFDDEVIDEPDLVVPHARVHERAFALAPAADIVPGLVHPVLKRTVLQLLDDLRRTA